MATVRKHCGKWSADFVDQNKKRRIERPKGPFPNRALERRAAEELLAKRLAEVRSSTFTPSRERAPRAAPIPALDDLNAVYVPPITSGVYFLIRGDVVVYVGQSSVVLKRIADHRAARKIEFDHAFAMPCAVADLDALEDRMVRRFVPPENKLTTPYCAVRAVTG